MSANRGKSARGCDTEIMANEAYMRHLDPVAGKASLTKIRKSNTALRNRIQKINSGKVKENA